MIFQVLAAVDSSTRQQLRAASGLFLGVSFSIVTFHVNKSEFDGLKRASPNFPVHQTAMEELMRFRQFWRGLIGRQGQGASGTPQIFLDAKYQTLTWILWLNQNLDCTAHLSQSIKHVNMKTNT